MPATTDFLQINPTAANQENDATYLTDVTRTGGLITDQIIPSPLLNKIWFQFSTFSSAFCTMLANKGFSTSDGAGVIGGFNALVAVLANVQTTADLKSSIVAVSYATSVNFNAATASGFYLQLTGNVSATALSNTSAGSLLFVIQQDATGGRTMPWPSALSFATTAVCPQPNSFTIMQCVVLPDAQIIPVAPIVWISASGALIPPNPSSVIQLSSSGNVSNQFAEITEEVNTSGGAVTRNLYTAVGYTGFKVTIKNQGPTINNVLVQCLVGGQTIDGFPNFPVPPYGATTFQSDGANWLVYSNASVGAQVTKQQTFLTSGTFTPSTALLELGGWVQVFAVGGGGGGYETNPGAGLGGGGGSVVGPVWVQISGPVTVTIGAGGAGGAPGSNGGTTSFGSFVSATGGFAATSTTGGASGNSTAGSGGGVFGGGAGAGGTPTAVYGGPSYGGGQQGGPGLFGYAGGGAAAGGGVYSPGCNGGGNSNTAGQANTGGGGGGGGYAGGSGICIIVYIE